jgi:hypothetical protein
LETKTEQPEVAAVKSEVKRPWHKHSRALLAAGTLVVIGTFGRVFGPNIVDDVFHHGGQTIGQGFEQTIRNADLPHQLVAELNSELAKKEPGFVAKTLIPAVEADINHTYHTHYTAVQIMNVLIELGELSNQTHVSQPNSANLS